MYRLHRLLIVAPPGQGKTSLLRRIVQTYRPGGLLVDPLDEFGGVAGLRWIRLTEPRRVLEDADAEPILDELGRLEEGAAFVMDEANRYVPPGWDANPILQALDTARNRGIRVALAEKRPTRLHTLVADLADVMVYRPFRSAAAKGWLERADLPSDVPDPGPFNWYLSLAGGEPEEPLSMEPLARAFGGEIELATREPAE